MLWSCITTSGPEFAAATLIRQRRIGEAIAQHDGSALPGGQDPLIEVLRACGEIQEHLSDRAKLLILRIEQDGPNLQPDFGPAGFLRLDHFAARAPQPVGEQPHLRAFARSVRTFERDERPGTLSHRRSAEPSSDLPRLRAWRSGCTAAAGTRDDT